MGWWDTGIMGGDGPLDTQDDLEDKFGEGLDISSDVAYQYILDNTSDYNEQVGSVVGFLMMKNGRAMDARLKAKIIETVDAERADLEMWNNPAERHEALTVFLEQLIAYDGLPVTIKQTGLFEKINESMS